MGVVFEDELFDAQWLRAAGHASSGGAEIGECLAAARGVRELQADSWFSSWFGLAERLEAEADACLASGRRCSAREAYLRAANYFRTAYTFLIGTPVDPRLVEAYRRHRKTFAAAARLMEQPADRIEIPYAGAHLHGYLFSASGTAPAPRPALIVCGGYDSTAEEAYHFSGAAAVARGYDCVTFDGPGQGAAIIEAGLVFRPDWEAVIGPVVDFVLGRPQTDPARIALMGVSFGGCLAPRAASRERRLGALVVDPGQRSLFDEMKSRMPAFIARELPAGNPLALALLRFILARRQRRLTAGWALRRGMWVHGAKSAFDYLRLTEAYGVGRDAHRIACPTLVCSAENDDIGVTARQLHEPLSCEKTFITFSAHDGAGAHCEAGARSRFNQRAFDWLDGVFATSAARSPQADEDGAPS